MVRVPDLHVSQTETSPFLIGVRHPRIVISQSVIDGLDPAGIRAVLLHELMHWRRRDTWIGWGQVFVQGLMWFHPLVWWASCQLRNERENVCDDAVVRFGTVPAQRYAEVILQVLTTTRGRSRASGSLVGVFERGTNLQQRLEDVMLYESKPRSFGWVSGIFLLVFALVFIPMGRSERTQVDASPDRAAAGETSSTNAPEPRRSPYPTIIKTEPEFGATGVSSALKEITVTFDRDMSSGMSWTGGGPEFPPVDKSRKATWTDKRTCMLPVKLDRGTFYRVGVNSKRRSKLQKRGRCGGSPDGPPFRYSGCQQSGRTTGTRAPNR